MEDQEQQQIPKFTSSKLIIGLMSKRTTWVCLLVVVYAILLSSSWKILESTFSWYGTTSNSSGWPALYASAVLGAVFGLLSTAATAAVAMPAAVVMWITMMVLLAFCGKSRRTLVAEGSRLTAEIGGFVVKILVKEGNVVAAVCAVVGYVALVWRSKEGFNPT